MGRLIRSLLFSLVVILFVGCSAAKNPPLAQNGILDLRGQAWTSRGFFLNGEWLFFPKSFLSPGKDTSSEKRSQRILVPGGWNGKQNSPLSFSADGYGTYSLRILLDPSQEAISFYLPNIHSAYRLFVNGRLLTAVGNPGSDSVSTTPQLYPETVELHDTPAELRVVIQVANFHHRNGGLWKSPQVLQGRTASKNWRIDFAAAWAEFGLYMGMAFLFFALYLGTLRRPELVYFSLLSLVTAMRAILTGQRTLVHLFPDFSFHANYAIEYVTFVAAPPLLVSTFYAHFFSGRRLIFYVPFRIVQAIGLLFLAIIALTPARVYTEIYPVAVIFMFVNTSLVFFMLMDRLIAKDRDGLIFLPGFLILAAAVVNDYLHNRNTIETGYFATYALAAFLIFMGIALGLSVRRIALEKRRIEADSRARNVFFSTISHELRTPLNAIYGNLQLMESTLREPETLQRISAMRHGCDVLLNLINDILDLGRISADSFKLHHTPVNLPRLIESMLQLFSGPVNRKGIALRQNLEGNIPEFILTDEFRLKQVIMNLIGNALKFTEKGHIVIGCKAQPDGTRHELLTFSVADSGIGIPEDEQRKIFEEFYQARSQDKMANQGTGLGLTIARRLVAFMGGHLTLLSEPDKGSTFSFTIRVERTAAPEAVPPGIPIADGQKHRKILVAEDDEISRLILCTFLENAGYGFNAVADGDMAMVELARETYDLLLLDIKMPGLSGTDIARNVRTAEKKEKTQRKILIAVTANVMPDDIVRIKEAGFDAIVPKPVNFSELEKLLSA